MYMPGGMNSWSQSTALGDDTYWVGMNVACRGGKVRTRPGTQIRANLPQGNLQGCTFFVPNGGIPAHVVAISGKVYIAHAPFVNYQPLPNVQFSPYSRFMAWAQCQQSTDYDSTGTITFLPQPRTVLIMQDGVTRAAFWDGSSSGHINPTISRAQSLPSQDLTALFQDRSVDVLVQQQAVG